jgi:hypothetical protein
MGIRQSVALRPKELLNVSTDAVRDHLQRFTKQRPMVVSPKMLDALSKKPELADLMDRVKVRQ